MVDSAPVDKNEHNAQQTTHSYLKKEEFKHTFTKVEGYQKTKKKRKTSILATVAKFSLGLKSSFFDLCWQHFNV